VVSEEDTDLLDELPIVQITQPPSKTIVPHVSHTDALTDTWDPWEDHAPSKQLVLSTGSSEKGKRNTPPEVRHSSRLQQKQVKGAGPSGVGTDSLLDHFPFVNFTDSEVISLFENIGFSLGHKEDIKVSVVSRFRSLLKSRFKKIVINIQDKYKHSASSKDIALIDISDEILSISFKE
jgi:hypothetical protein